MFRGAVQDVSFCPECLVNGRETARQIKDYVIANKGCSVSELSSIFNISMKEVRDHLKDDSIEILGDNRNFLLCEKCSAPVNSGKYCDRCRV